MSREHVSTRRRLSLESLEDRLCLSTLPVGTALTQPDAATQAHLSASYGQLPLSFAANQGQTDPRVNFLARGAGYSVFLTPTKAVLSLRQGSTSNVVDMRVVGANPASHAVGLDKHAGVSNYFIGNDPLQWHTDVPNYGKVDYQSVYRGIDLVYHGNQKQLEYDFVVAPGADSSAIRLAFDGMQSASLDRAGNLVLHTSGGDVVEHAPVVYQVVNGQRQAVAGRYVLLGHHQVGFQVGRYDHSKPLVIDPTLSYSTYLGGGGDAGVAVAVDGSGKAYVTGVTSSTNFPTKNPLQPKNAGGEDVFVAEFDTTLAGAASLVYSTYLGGSGDDYGTGIAVDSNGNAYLTGSTHSTNFPTFHAAQASGGGGWDSFVTELNNTGTALVYSTYLGGSGSEQGRTGYHSPYGIALSTDASGNTFAYVAGETTSTDFPTTPGAYQRVFGGGRSDAYVVKLNPALKGPQSLVYSSYFGGNSEDGAYGIAADTAGNAYLTGDTLSTNLPTTPGAYQTTAPGGFNAFVTEFNPTGSGLVYSTYLGGSNVDEGRGIAIDGAGNAYVTGYTSSTDFPTQNAAQSTNAGQTDAFVTQLNATGTGLLYSTYHGGSSLENGIGIAVDNAGNAYVTGYTRSSDFPIKNAFKTTNVSGNQTDFVTKLNPSLSGPDSLVYSSYLGGSGGENDETAVAVDKVTGEAYVTGATSSTDFPTKNPFQAHLSKGKNAQNAFLSKISAS